MQVNDFYVERNVAKISVGVKTIQCGILPISINKVEIPSSVETIIKGAIDCDTIYDGIEISKDEIAIFGSDNIIRIATLKKHQVDYSKLPYEVFTLLPLTNDAIKGYIANHKRYLELRKKVGSNFETLFKLSYTLGLFNVPLKTKVQIEQMIINLINYQDINDYFKDITLKDINIAFISIVLEIYRKGEITRLLPYYKSFYENTKEIKDIIRKRKEYLLSLKNKQKRMLEEQNQNTDGISLEINQLKDQSKVLTLDDIIDYFDHYDFAIREGNEALENILPLVRKYILSQDLFDILQDIYEEARSKKGEASKIFSSTEGKYDQYYYRWLENDDYENLVLGYLVDCCAKLGHVGEDIMRYSMTRSDVRTLVVYDGMKRIIGKTTAFYSMEGKYLLCNNIEVTNSFIHSTKISEKQKEALLQTFLQGLKAQANAMELLGFMVNEIRIGMLHNNLDKQLEQYQIEKKSLLPNIKYGSYIGDASNIEFGQAIVYEKGGTTK